MAKMTYGKCDGCLRAYDRNAPACPYCETVERVLCQLVDSDDISDCDDLATGTAASGFDACDDHRDQPYTAESKETQ